MPIGFVGPALQGASFIGRFGIPLIRNMGIGGAIGGAIGGGIDLYNAAQKTPDQTNAVNRNRRSNVGRNDANYSGIIGSIPPSANGESYRDAELRLGNRGGSGGNAGYSVTPFRPIGGTPAERAQAAETSRVAQLTAQDPELQRYEAARGVAKTQEEMNAVRDEGMRIWAAKHGGLAAKVKPGSSGYEAIQSSIGPSTASSLSNEQVLGLMSFDPNAVLKTTQGIQSQFRPNQELTGQEILSAMSFDPNVAMKSAANMAYAPMSPAEAAMLQQVGGAKGEYITPMNATGGVEQAGNNSALFEELLKRATNKK